MYNKEEYKDKPFEWFVGKYIFAEGSRIIHHVVGIAEPISYFDIKSIEYDTKRGYTWERAHSISKLLSVEHIFEEHELIAYPHFMKMFPLKKQLEIKRAADENS